MLIGCDTRLSSDMLVHALASGVSQAGGDAEIVGVIPTPAVAYLTRSLGAACGIVVSASHNPYEDNGIKLFGADGFKLSDALEEAIEDRLNRGGFQEGSDFGTVRLVKDGVRRYLDFLKGTVRLARGKTGARFIVDCANGAASEVAGTLFQELGLSVRVIHDRPDGKNINRDCGSQHPRVLSDVVRSKKADAGFALDGDGDRLIAVDDTGAVLTGDRILAILARHLQRSGRLAGEVVVSTVMSNAGLGRALCAMGIRHVTTRVGDRWVMEAMRQHGAVLGGEDSGHLIFASRHTTGDGLLTALLLIEALLESGAPLSQLKQVMTPFPQVLMNVPVSRKPELESVEPIQAAIRAIQEELNAEGRVLVRYSGTEPLCRVMVEGPTEEVTRSLCARLAETVAKILG